MAKSKSNKSHKERLSKYKKSKQMSKNAPEMAPFQQIPTWKSDDTFEIKGSELEALYNYFNFVAPAFTSINQIFARGIQGGKIQMKYVYEDGSEVPKEEVNQFTEKLNAYFKEKMNEQELNTGKANEAASDLSNNVEDKPQAKILSFTGEPVSSDNV